MRITLAGAEITDAIVEVIDNLQNFHDVSRTYLQVLDELTRMLILDTSDFSGDDSATMERLHTLQMIRQDLLTLSMPPDADLPENDIPAFEA